MDEKQQATLLADKLVAEKPAEATPKEADAKPEARVQESNVRFAGTATKPLENPGMDAKAKKILIGGFCALILLGVLYLCYTTFVLFNDRAGEEGYWNKYLTETLSLEDQQYVESISTNATEVTAGSYLETIREVNMKTSSYRLTLKVWFKWKGDPSLDMINNFHVYNGIINKLEVLENYERDGMNYQQARVDISVYKNFWTRRFPLESHQLRYYLESSYTIDKVKFVADSEHSGTNGGVNYAGFDLTRFSDAVHTQIYDSTYGQDHMKNAAVTSEYMGQIELNRDGWGLYLKCFIALFGTSCWVFITMFLCTYHRVDPLGMIPAALFGTVSNIMVGANLLPDALQTGLLEYVNIWGIFTILSGALVIININRIRSKYQDIAFAKQMGRTMFFSLLSLVLIGHAIMPLAAFRM